MLSGTTLALDDPKFSFTGQRISELLPKIGSNNIPQELMSHLLEGKERKERSSTISQAYQVIHH
jgi:hypothetical protein